MARPLSLSLSRSAQSRSNIGCAVHGISSRLGSHAFARCTGSVHDMANLVWAEALSVGAASQMRAAAAPSPVLVPPSIFADGTQQQRPRAPSPNQRVEDDRQP